MKSDNESKLKHFQAARLHERADEHFKMASEFIRATLMCANQTIHDELIRSMLTQSSIYPPEGLVTLLLSFKQDYQQEATSHWWYQQALQQLYEQLYKQLFSQLQKGERKSSDWSIMVTNKCSCDDCQDLNLYLQSKTSKVKIWPLSKSRRMHIHQIIDVMKLPVTHQTQRTGWLPT